MRGVKEGSATITANSEEARGTTTVSIEPVPTVARERTQSPAQTQPPANTPTMPSIAFALIPERSWSLGTYEVTQGQWKAVMGTEPWKGQ